MKARDSGMVDREARGVAVGFGAPMRSCSALLGGLLLLAHASVGHAQTNVTGGDCSQIVHAEQGATVVIHCVERARKQLDDTQGEKRRVERHLSETKTQLLSLQAGLDKLQVDVHALRQTDDQSPRIQELEAQMVQRREELRQKQAELAEEQASALRTHQQIAELEHSLQTYALHLRSIERDRITPDAYHWLGFSAALIGFGVATGFGVASAQLRSDLSLEPPFPTMTRAEAKDMALSIRRNNLVADVGLVVGLLGTAVGASYLWDVLVSETPGIDVISVSAGTSELAIHVRARFGGAL